MPKVHIFMHCSFSAINALRQVEQADKYDGVFWIKLSASVCSGGYTQIAGISPPQLSDYRPRRQCSHITDHN